METEQEAQQNAYSEEEANNESLQAEQKGELEEYAAAEETTEQNAQKNLKLGDQAEDRSSFIHGLAVGLGIGCIATFVIVWIAIFFTPLLPGTLTYENMLSIFIFPLIYLLAVGLIALTAGIVREYYTRKNRF